EKGNQRREEREHPQRMLASSEDGDHELLRFEETERGRLLEREGMEQLVRRLLDHVEREKGFVDRERAVREVMEDPEGEADRDDKPDDPGDDRASTCPQAVWGGTTRACAPGLLVCHGSSACSTRSGTRRE